MEKNEGFKFDALMTIHDESILKDKNEIFSLIKIKSRIKGLQGISVTRLPEAKTYKTKLARFIYSNNFNDLLYIGWSCYLQWYREERYF